MGAFRKTADIDLPPRQGIAIVPSRIIYKKTCVNEKNSLCLRLKDDN
jgi:hypothetical protein